MILKDLLKGKCILYNIKSNLFIIKFISFLVKDGDYITENWINFIEYILHNSNVKDEYILNYSINFFKNNI